VLQQCVDASTCNLSGCGEVGAQARIVFEDWLLPRAGLHAQLLRKGEPFATLRATPQMLMLRKSFYLSPPKVDMSFTLHTMAGVTYEGAFARCFRCAGRVPAAWFAATCLTHGPWWFASRINCMTVLIVQV
jgi:hypothetical protein